MISKIAIITVAFASLATAANQSPNVPVSAQIGSLNFGIQCQAPILGNQTYATLITATAPVQGVSGQEIYYSDVVTQFTIPGSITALGGFIGGSQASADIKLALDLVNASPQTFDVFPNGIALKNITFTPGQPVTARLPSTGTISPIGPVTLGQAGTPHLIHVGRVDITIYVLDKDGKTVFGPLPISCVQQAIAYDIGTVNVLSAGSGNFPSKPSNGGNGMFAPISNGQETGSFRFPYDCDFGGVIQQEIDLAITGTVPTYFNPGQQFQIKDGYAYLRVPSQIVTTLNNIFPTVTQIRTNVTTFNLGTQNGSPASLNILSQPQSQTSSLQAGRDIEFAIPGDGTLSLGPFTAGSAGSEFFLDTRDAQGTVDLLEVDGNNLGSVPFTCTPKFASVLIGVPVTNTTAPEITK